MYIFWSCGLSLNLPQLSSNWRTFYTCPTTIFHLQISAFSSTRCLEAIPWSILPLLIPSGQSILLFSQLLIIWKLKSWHNWQQHRPEIFRHRYMILRNFEVFQSSHSWISGAQIFFRAQLPNLFAFGLSCAVLPPNDIFSSLTDWLDFIFSLSRSNSQGSLLYHLLPCHYTLAIVSWCRRFIVKEGAVFCCIPISCRAKIWFFLLYLWTSQWVLEGLLFGKRGHRN